MSESLVSTSDKEPVNLLYNRLIDLRDSVWEEEDIPPSLAITKDIYPDGIPIQVRLSGIDEGDASNDFMVLKLGDDLADPTKHDCIVAKKDGEVYRYDSRVEHYYPMSSDDLEVLELVVKTFEDQYRDTSV